MMSIGLVASVTLKNTLAYSLYVSTSMILIFNAKRRQVKLR